VSFGERERAEPPGALLTPPRLKPFPAHLSLLISARKKRPGDPAPNRRSLVGIVLIIEQDERDALVDGVVLGEVDGPASGLQQFAVVGFPLIADTRATIRDETR
jgi:hypothetical protein